LHDVPRGPRVIVTLPQRIRLPWTTASQARHGGPLTRRPDRHHIKFYFSACFKAFFNGPGATPRSHSTGGEAHWSEDTSRLATCCGIQRGGYGPSRFVPSRETPPTLATPPLAANVWHGPTSDGSGWTVGTPAQDKAARMCGARAASFSDKSESARLAARSTPRLSGAPPGPDHVAQPCPLPPLAVGDAAESAKRAPECSRLGVLGRLRSECSLFGVPSPP
jgi:hypothetical protein